MLRKVEGAKVDDASEPVFQEPSPGPSGLLGYLVDHAGDAIEVLDAGTLDFVDVNQTACEVLGYRRDELLAMNVRDIDPVVDDRTIKHIDQQLRSKGSLRFETSHRRKDGVSFPVEIHIRRVFLDRPYNIAFVRDISERRKTEQELSRLNWALEALSRGSAAVVHSPDEATLYKRCCDAITGVNAYPLAWIGLARDCEGQPIECVAAAGSARNYLIDLNISWGEGSPSSKGPSGTAIRTGQTQVIEDMWSNTSVQQRQSRARAFGLSSLIAVPILVDKKPIGLLAVYSGEPHAFGDGVRQPIEDLADEIAYGIASRRTQTAYLSVLEEQARQATRLRDTLDGAVMALAATVEHRDPYTAGHQSRVAELAVAIGRERGMGDDQLEGLRIASALHDIGKIAIPGEILTRPGRLSETELALVRVHAQAGYDIIKGIDFPWPVAEIVYQHHERLDGSGYPRGLKGEQVMEEARILAVADTVEAMVSHRPYRSGRGLKAALDQIREDAGTKLDVGVVTACCRLFEQGRFHLPTG